MLQKKFLMSLLCLVVVLSLSATVTRGANILFVASMTAEGDDTLKAFMEGLGHTVTYIDDDEDEATTEAAALAADMVFISESVSSGKIKNEITELEVPMVVGEPYAWDEMGLTEGGGGDDAVVTTDIEIVAPEHYLAAGLSGSVTVLSGIAEGCNLGKGITGPEATVIARATLSDGVTYDVIFVYEKGAALPVAPADGSPQVAADIRIGIGFHANCYPVLTDNYYALLEAAINYALGETGPAVQVLERTIVDDADDAEEDLNPSKLGEIDATSSDLELAYEDPGMVDPQLVALRYTDITIPKGATITAASVQFQVDEDKDGTLPVNLIIEGELSLNPTGWPADTGPGNFGISLRPRTTAVVQWSVPNWINVGDRGPDQATPDISAVIQEIVNQDGWVSGNALVLIFSDDPTNPSSGIRCAEAGPGDDAAFLHIEYLEPAPAPGANIIWVTSTRDYDLDGLQDDQAWIDWLVAEGHTVDVRMDYWNELDLEPNKVDELNAADLVIMSRSTNSGDHDDGDEPTLWNSVTTPLITLNCFLVRSSRWRWMDTTSTVNGDDILLALDTTHPIFDGVTFEMGNMVIFRDNTVGSGQASFVGSIDAGNGTLIAQTLSAENTWIAEWAAGAEFYAGSGQTAGGPRMLFVAGTQEIDGPPPTAWGAWDLTAEGEKIFRNAISYMLAAAAPEAPAGPSLVAAYAFGSRPLECPTYNDPSVNYTIVLHESPESVQYDPARGYGYEVIYPTDSPFGDRSGYGKFGPFDNSANNRNEFPDECPEELYDSFIGAKSFSSEVSMATMGDMDTPSPNPEGIIFRADVPNGLYRFVGAFGEADNVHAHRILAEDGGSGPPENIGPNHVVLVHNHDQAQYAIGEIAGDNPGDAVFARVGFDGLIPPPGDGVFPDPQFVDMDENGKPTEAGANSPVLEVTQGYIRIHQLQGNSNDGPGGPRDANGGDIVILELWKVGP